MADSPQATLQDLEQTSQTIISKLESALNVKATSELASLVSNLNGLLEKQASIVQNISVNSTDRLQQVNDETTQTKETTAELQKHAKIYQEILSINDENADNWDTMIKQSATLGKNYSDINKKQKEYLTNLNLAAQQEKKLTDMTVKRMKIASSMGGSQAKQKKSSGKIPQFINIQGLASNQIGIEAMSGGKPYFASHPEMGVPVGLFNTKDEPNRSARIKAIQKYGPSGSLDGSFPQYAKSGDDKSKKDTKSEDKSKSTKKISKK